MSFNGTGSSDPEGRRPLTYAWDFDGDGQFDDSTAVTPRFTYSQPGSYGARLRVTDPHRRHVDSAPVSITANNTPPTASISDPDARTHLARRSDDHVLRHGDRPAAGNLPASALTWQLVLLHGTCPSDCHDHSVQTWTGVACGSFVAPDHEYPS